MALIKGQWEEGDTGHLVGRVTLLLHHTGIYFGSCRCDCGPQLHQAMKMVEAHGKGLVLYMNQEGRA